MLRMILCSIFVCGAVLADGPAFESVTIVANGSGVSPYSMKVQSKPQPVKLTMRNVTLQFCIEQAYSVQSYQVSGPGWIGKARYDIAATLPAGAGPEQVWLALQALLAERFQLSTHRAKKEMSLYSLTVAKGGPALSPAQDRSSNADTGGIEGASARLRLNHVSLAQWCEVLSRNLKRPVRDATGIAGFFDFDLQYGRNGDGSGPSLSKALELELGLKLDPGKGAVDILVVDGALRTPSAR